MLDITLQNFETDLIGGSRQQPVLLDIWAPWCGPCKALGPVLEKLETAYDGRFALAKLNADEQPEISGQLSQMFGVRSIPFCVLFKDGQPVDGFVGALPEAEVRAFLDRHVPSAEDFDAEADVAEAEALLADGDLDSALERLQEAVTVDPGNDDARFEYLRALLSAGRPDEARRAYEPVASKILQDARIAACGHWLAAFDSAAAGSSVASLQAAVSSNKRDFAARFALAQHHFAAQQFTEAMDELLEILMRDKAWHDELARKTYVAVLDLMTSAARRDAAPGKALAANPGQGQGQNASVLAVVGNAAPDPQSSVVDAYRRKLSMTLF